MENLNVPTRAEVSEGNQAIFDNLEKALGFVPNLYAAFAHNETALADVLALQNRKSTLKAKEREVINLVTSEINDCLYCLSAHTALGKMNGFSEAEILEIRGGNASFDAKIDALVKLVQEVNIKRGKPSQEVIDAFFAAGYTKANLVDVIVVVGDKTISNYLHGIGQFAIDFPVAEPLEAQAV